MYIAATYLFNDPNDYIEKTYPDLLKEVAHVIESIDAEACKTKKGKEKTNKGKLLYSPKKLNKAFKKHLTDWDWAPYKLRCQYPVDLYTERYHQVHKDHNPKFRSATREIDFVKGKLGMEVQFGKYAFMAYDILGKMVILHKQGVINAGIELVPVRAMTGQMSTGVSYFEQIVWDLQHRGPSDLDIPVLILGIDP